MDRTSRALGLSVFVLGIAMLLIVFAVALWMFIAGGIHMSARSEGSGAVSALGSLGNATAAVFIRIALLFVVALAGSLVAGRGVDLYLGSRKGPGHVIGEEEKLGPED